MLTKEQSNEENTHRQGRILNRRIGSLNVLFVPALRFRPLEPPSAPRRRTCRSMTPESLPELFQLKTARFSLEHLRDPSHRSSRRYRRYRRHLLQMARRLR